MVEQMWKNKCKKNTRPRKFEIWALEKFTTSLFEKFTTNFRFHYRIMSIIFQSWNVNFNLLNHSVSIYRITEFQFTESLSFSLPNHWVSIYRVTKFQFTESQSFNLPSHWVKHLKLKLALIFCWFDGKLKSQSFINKLGLSGLVNWNLLSKSKLNF